MDARADSGGVYCLNEDEQALAETCREFAAGLLASNGVDWDQTKRFPVNLIAPGGQGVRLTMSGPDGGPLNVGACSLGGAEKIVRDLRMHQFPEGIVARDLLRAAR